MSEDERLAAEWAAAEGEDGGEGGDGGDGMSEEERAAAEWESMADEEGAEGAEGAEGGGGEVPGQATRVLDQDEIDSLLGFGDDDGGGETTGVMAIINSALVSYERLPMLEVVFDRLVRMLSTSLRNFTSDNVEVSLDNITSVRFGDYLNSIPLPAMLSVFIAEEWDNYGLVTVDSSLIYSIVDVLLGGRRGTAPMRIEGRPYTTIERTLVSRLIQVFLSDLSSAFDPLSPVIFRSERLETNPRFATIARPANAAILTRLRIDMEDRGGKLDLLLPYATLEPVRELLLQMFMGEKFGRDSIWENHLAKELWSTDVAIDAVLDRVPMSLGSVLNLKIGDHIPLNVTDDSDIEMTCGERVLFLGKMGRKGRNIAVRLFEEVGPKVDEFAEEELG
ncbi:MAG: flagellar motor switch protein FliM [Alphaproteobacteria bacterium]|nr:flagellar motor switch protein FliM [Alphaproteobacteria bacterium]